MDPGDPGPFRVDALPLADLGAVWRPVEDLRHERAAAVCYRELLPSARVAALVPEVWSVAGSATGLAPIAFGDVEVPAVVAAAVEGGRILGRGHLLLPDGRLAVAPALAYVPPGLARRLADPAQPPDEVPLWHWRAQPPQSLALRDVGAEALFIGVVFIGNFGHNLLEVMPRVALARLAGLAGLPLLLSRATPRFALEMLEVAGMAPSQFRFFDHQQEIATAGRLYLPGLAQRYGVLHPWLGGVFDEFAARLLPRARGGGPRRLYLSRERWETGEHPRSLANRAEVQALVARFGFAPVCSEELTLAEQVRLFHDCEAIIAEDGSAPHASVFSPQGTPLLLLRHPGRGIYYHLAVGALRRQRLGVVDGEALPSEGRRGDERPYRVPLARLEAALQAFFRV